MANSKMPVRCTTAFASIAITVLTSYQAAYADPGDDDPAKAAFGNAVSFTIPTGSAKFSVPLAQVPSGKRYVIELVSLSCSSSGGAVPSAVLNVGQQIPDGEKSSSTQAVSISMQFQGQDEHGVEYLMGTLAARMYADDITGSPSDVLLNVIRSSTFTPMQCAVSVSGYLVSLRHRD